MREEVLQGELSPFRGVSAACLDALLRHSVEHRVGPGTVLFDQGEVPNFQYVLTAGSVHLFGRSVEEREVLIEVVCAPDLVIPAAVMTASPFLMQARVPEPSRFLLIHAEVFREAVATDAGLAQAVIATLSRQFRRMVRQTKNLKLRSSTQRVGCYLLALSERQGTPARALLPYEKHVIASELGMTRESFSRALASLERDGIRVDGQVIAILDRGRLVGAALPDPLIDPGLAEETARAGTGPAPPPAEAAAARAAPPRRTRDPRRPRD
ncbi:transcriptional regulator, Crp/Fnr family [Methylobacterium sp. 4-46]|uniref:helix-turn-helix domain-containing protein n=1 Tax=unclassified Methylobacterium TaxID=2615210 RepID=UPI000165CD6F|nr:MULTISPECIES: helix-turn-helix domain-containing protein [Methylobacterium]ACA20404.1 transcriptional regulator, Crp/Fnr family [Methylobacterium sp. 4-46]WFT79572.1 helix-turn-helix domain-containing protein [Methylobacterium nodulans]